jgi:hypothetical protein
MILSHALGISNLQSDSAKVKFICIKQKWEMYDDIVEETGYEINSLREYKRVAENIINDICMPDLSFSHHVEVAPLTPEKQELFMVLLEMQL